MRCASDERIACNDPDGDQEPVPPGQVYAVTDHRNDPVISQASVRVTRLSGSYGFYVQHALGESKIGCPRPGT